MAPRGRRPSVAAPFAAGAPSSPVMATAPSSSSAISISIPARTNHESPFDYANRIFATELLREAHDAEHATLRTRHDQQIKELKAAVGALSKRERTTLLQRYQDLAGAELAELTKKLEEERAGTAFGFVLLIIIFGLVW